MPRHKPDRFEQLGTFIHKLKIALFDFALLIVFVVWLYQKLLHEVRPMIPENAAPADLYPCKRTGVL